jgi:hypothetical protein
MSMLSPKDCRDFAAECVVLANGSVDAEFQSILFNVARSWNNTAAFNEHRARAMNSHEVVVVKLELATLIVQ